MNTAKTVASSGYESVVGSGIFGIGIGYSLKTTDNLVQAEQKPTAKADSVGLYVKQIGHKLLPFLLSSMKYAATSSRPKTSSVVSPVPNVQSLMLSGSSAIEEVRS